MMILEWTKQVPWTKFFLLWSLALLMGGSLLWLHWGFADPFGESLLVLAIGVGSGLLWATSRPQWQKIHCSWCGKKIRAQAVRKLKRDKAVILIFPCEICGHISEMYS